MTKILAARSPRRRGLARGVVGLVAIAVVGTMLAACGGGGGSKSADSGNTISGVNGDPSNQPAGAPWGSTQIAEGWDKSSGYTLKWDVAASAAAALQLLSAGKINVAQTSTSNAYAAAKLDPNIRIIGFLDGPTYLIAAPQNSGIKTAADLSGKTVGVIALGSASQLQVQGAMRAAGKDPNSVTFLPVGNGAPMAQALDSGKIQAIAGWEGMWETISSLTKTPLQIVDSAVSDLPGTMATVTTQSMIDKHKDLLVAYLKNFYKACSLGAIDPARLVTDHWKVFSNVAPPASEKAEQITKQAALNKQFYTNCAQPSADKQMAGTLSTAEIEKTYKFLRSNNIVEADVDTSKIVNTSLVEQALQGFDLKSWAEQYNKS